MVLYGSEPYSEGRWQVQMGLIAGRGKRTVVPADGGDSGYSGSGGDDGQAHH